MWTSRAWRSAPALHASDLTLPEGTTLAVDPETLILHVLAAPTAEQIEAEIGEGGEECRGAGAGR